MKAAAAFLGLVLTAGTVAAASYDESIDGDLSGDRLAPTLFALDPGLNPLIVADTQFGDLEYVTVNVPASFSLEGVILSSYVSANQIAFAAVQAGTIFSQDPAFPDPAGMLGLTHFGSFVSADTANPGDDLLDNMGGGTFGGQGFSQPLPSGDYTFWIQQTSPVATAYTLDFVVVPEPAAAALAIAALLLAGFARAA